MSLDHSIVLFLNQFTGTSALLDGALVFFAESFPYVLTLLFIFFSFRRWPLVRPRLFLIIEGVGAAVLARVFVEVIRLFVHRLRPFVADPISHVLFLETSSSFPSGHAAFFFALSTIVYFHNKRWGVWFFFASALIGFARVMAGVHYPTDIIGGAVLGIVVGFGVHKILKKRAPHLSLRLFHNPPL